MTASVHNALDFAKIVCELSKWTVTNLQLQKILFLLQTNYMGTHGGTPLFDANFQAWDYGPVEPNVYHRVKCYGASPIEPQIFFSREGKNIPEDEESYVKQSLDVLLKITPAQLVSFTHRKGSAWSKKYCPGFSSRITNDDIMQDYANATARK